MNFFKASVLAVALLGSSAWAGNFLSGLGAAFQGQSHYQCMQSCRPGDGQCYQACNAAYGPQQQQQQYTPPKAMYQDAQCMNNCTQRGYIYQLCEKNCSY